MIRIIACTTSDGRIGCDNNLIVSYKEDMSHFRKMTADSTVIMGLKTFKSMGSKPLPKRKNIIVSESAKFLSSITPASNLKIHDTMDMAIKACSNDENIWLIGGYSIYKEGMNYADEIVLTITPDVAQDRKKSYTDFPWINPLKFEIKSIIPFKNNNDLLLATYQRIV